MIVDDFAKSNVANFKRVYIEFCIHALNVTSHSFFKTNLLPSLMALAKDKSVPVKLRFLKRVVPILNDTLGACDSSLTMELVQIVDKLKNDKKREVSDTAFDIDENVKFNKVPIKEKQREYEAREQELLKVEQSLKAREKFELEEEERKKKEAEEDKFDIEELLAKIKSNKKNKHYGFSSKRLTTSKNIDVGKKALQHRHSFTSMGSKKPILGSIPEMRRKTMDKSNS